MDDGLLQQPYLAQSDWTLGLHTDVKLNLLFELVFGIGLYFLVFFYNM